MGRLRGYTRTRGGGGRCRNAAAGSYAGSEDAPKPRHRGGGDSPPHDRFSAHRDFSSLLGPGAGGETGDSLQGDARSAGKGWDGIAGPLKQRGEERLRKGGPVCEQFVDVFFLVNC